MERTDPLDNTYFVIMAGGVGARFWPASRESLPKQFLDILGVGRSLIQMTYDRILPLVPPDRIIILTHEKYKNLVSKHLPDLPAKNILLEPSRNNTGPCVAYVSMHIAARNKQARMVILPADHMITKEQAFHKAIGTAVHYAATHPVILTLGMKPHRPDTGYGYIKLGKETDSKGIFSAASFTEKPDAITAQSYLDGKAHVWNAGIFITAVNTMISAFERHAPEIYHTLHAPKIFGTSREPEHIRSCYAKTPSISLDFAIMERAKNIVCMPADLGWSDIGTWKSLYELERSQRGGVVTNLPEANIEIQDSESLMIYGEGDKKFLINGIKNMIIVDKKDILLIWPLDQEQEIKNAREQWAKHWQLD